LKSSRRIKLNHLCHSQTSDPHSAAIVIERHRDEMAALVT